MDNGNQNLHYADIAFENKKYMEALAWYQKALAEKPDDVYALSRAGAICVSMGRFEQALKFFGQAVALDPQNGDNHFNYANACFFKRDFADAFAAYVEAEKRGCSQDVTPRLYYQMALMCSLRQDVPSALVYFRKCEESDATGSLSLSPDLISEKLKLYMLTEDYSNAERMAAQLVAIEPTAFRNYMVYYSILLAHKNFSGAEKLLADAKRYAALTPDDEINLVLQTAALHVARAEAGEEDPEAAYQKAIELLEAQAAAEKLSPAQRVNVLLTLAEAYQKAEMHDRAIACLSGLLGGGKQDAAPEAAAPAAPSSALTPEEIDEMIRVDTERIQELIYAGALDPNLGAYARVEYDENGYPVNVYDDEAFAAMEAPAESRPEEAPEAAAPAAAEPALPREQRERAWFLLLTSYLAKDRFGPAGILADALKRSENKHYSYYGRYVSALTARKTGQSPELVDRKYAEAIAFFRNRMFADHGDSLAAIFRARLYAEDGKLEKAREIAQLLADSDQKAVLDYIASLGADPV